MSGVRKKWGVIHPTHSFVMLSVTTLVQVRVIQKLTSNKLYPPQSMLSTPSRHSNASTGLASHDLSGRITTVQVREHKTCHSHTQGDLNSALTV
eukprot:4823464-Amphidinium_carterae.1